MPVAKGCLSGVGEVYIHFGGEAFRAVGVGAGDIWLVVRIGYPLVVLFDFLAYATGAEDKGFRFLAEAKFHVVSPFHWLSLLGSTRAGEKSCVSVYRKLMYS